MSTTSSPSESRRAPVEFSQKIGPIAIEVLGPPNKALSTKTELRWGNRGSFSVNTVKGTWCDHEDGDRGGGVLDLLKVKLNLEKEEALQWLRNHKFLPSAENNKSKIVATYDYRNENGSLSFEVVRFAPKKFRQRQPDGKGGWIWNMAGVQRVLYRLPEVIAAAADNRCIFVAEGEKGVAAIKSRGLIATCSPAGAGKWRAEYSPWLRNADVVLLPDNDDPGRKHVQQIAGFLLGIARRIRVLALPGLPQRGDVADWVANGGDRQALAKLAEDAPEANAKPNGAMPPFAAAGDRPAHETSSPPDESANVQRGDEEPPPPEIDDPNYHEAVKADAASSLDPVEAMVRQFNARYWVVNEAGKAVIYEPAYDAILKRRYHNKLAFADFEKLHLNRKVKVGDKFMPAAVVWLHHPDRRQYIRGVSFDPSGNHRDPEVLNLWQGFVAEPKAGDWGLMKRHTFEVICASSHELYDYLMDWMARLIQFPAQQGEVAVVLKGIEGTGKGILARALLYLLGQHALTVSHTKHLTGNFNAHLRDCVFLFADEAFYAGDKAHIGVLKALITEPTLTIEAKYANAVMTPNFTHILMASNEDWVVPASIAARRFFVLLTLATYVGNAAYFTAIQRQMEAGDTRPCSTNSSTVT